jgi:hypothetical protein
VGEEVPLEDVLAHLESIGYEKREPVEMVGEYSLRGGILDIFPAEAAKPVRIELFGDLIESIRRFDVETQRSVMKIAKPPCCRWPNIQKSRELFREIARSGGDRRSPVIERSESRRHRFPAGNSLLSLGPSDGSPGTDHLADRLWRWMRRSSRFVRVLWMNPSQVAIAAVSSRLWKRLDQIPIARVDPPISSTSSPATTWST